MLYTAFVRKILWIVWPLALGAVLNSLFAVTASKPLQDLSPRQNAPQASANASGNLLQQLNLTPEQRAQIREIRQESRDEMAAAVKALRQAQRVLDHSIYQDQTEESIVRERARAVSAAQTEVVRMRAITEFKVSRVLTPDQLRVFRNLREKARQRVEEQQRMKQTSLPNQPKAKQPAADANAPK